MRKRTSERVVGDPPEVVQVVKLPDVRAYACGVIRAEVWRVSQRAWRFRVWHVLGSKTLARGINSGLRRTTSDALLILQAFGADYEKTAAHA